MSEEKKEEKATEPAAAETASTSATAKEVGPSKTYHARYWTRTSGWPRAVFRRDG